MIRRIGAALLLGAACLAPAVASAADKCEPADISALSGWNGVWVGENLQTAVNGRELAGKPAQIVGMKLIGLEAPWKPEAMARLEAGLARGRGSRGIITAWDFPILMSAPSPFTIVVSPAETVIIGQYREIRYIFTDGRPHTSEDFLWPTPWGDSIGCWSDGTLTIDTIAVKYSPDADYLSPPLSDNAHFVEKITLTSPDRLDSDITITDPETLSEPWKVHMTYFRHPVLKRLYHEGDILENNREVLKDGQMTIAPPKEERPEQPSMPQETDLSAEQLVALAGTYKLDGAPAQFIFKIQYGRLYMRIDPAQPFFLPTRASDPFDLTAFFGRGSFHFTIGEDGKASGFTGTGPDGAPLKATRKAD